MLSRVANRIFWAARYLERAANTSRIISAYTQFIMDVPRNSCAGWDILIKTIDGEDEFYARYAKVTEYNVIKFLFLDPENPSSILACVRGARENIRITRDVMPAETWELLNEFKLFLDQEMESSIRRRNRYRFLDEVMLRTMQLSGLFYGSMHRDRSFQFLQLGRYLERCDMTTRLIDVGTADLADDRDLQTGLEVSLWANLLDSLSATSAYRREIGPLIEPAEVINFAVDNQQFPRSVRHCLDQVERLIDSLGNNSDCKSILGKANKMLDRFDAHKLSRQQLHLFIDNFQLELSHLNHTIAATWFFPEQR